MLAMVPLLNSRKSDSIPSEKITPPVGMFVRTFLSEKADQDPESPAKLA